MVLRTPQCLPWAPWVTPPLSPCSPGHIVTVCLLSPRASFLTPSRRPSTINICQTEPLGLTTLGTLNTVVNTYHLRAVRVPQPGGQNTGQQQMLRTGQGCPQSKDEPGDPSARRRGDVSLHLSTVPPKWSNSTKLCPLLIDEPSIFRKSLFMKQRVP